MQIIALGASYFFAVTALDTTTNVGTIDDLTSTARIVLVLPVAILDAVFILWVFTSLSKTLAQLQARRAGAKLDLYRSAVCLRLPYPSKELPEESALLVNRISMSPRRSILHVEWRLASDVTAGSYWWPACLVCMVHALEGAG